MSKGSFQYKGFTGTIEVSAEDKILYGKIFGINDLVTYEGESMPALNEAFKEAVEDYIYLCEKAGKEPMKSFKGSFNVRVKPEIHLKAALKSSELGLSLNQFVERAIDHELNQTQTANSN